MLHPARDGGNLFLFNLERSATRARIFLLLVLGRRHHSAIDRLEPVQLAVQRVQGGVISGGTGACTSRPASPSKSILMGSTFSSFSWLRLVLVFFRVVFLVALLVLLLLFVLRLGRVGVAARRERQQAVGLQRQRIGSVASFTMNRASNRSRKG